jgi:cob(I)alamin adenosyltransferase
MTDIDEQVAVPRCYMTALADGTLVSKTDARIATCGDLDELSAHLGAVCAALKKMTETVESYKAEELRQILMRLHDVQR